ncbi:transaldolase family protein [Vibrio harveyi]|uniref:transaldolase family protein n=1 Tax=Vibrio harveyi TaxID=669 RepID=UPI00217D4D73|nr:transaldolase family protein [Vibrio harveyi]
MSVYLDTSDIEQIKTLSDLLPIAGVTTNPTIVAKSGVKMVNLLPQIREALASDGLIFGQVISTNADEIVDEALKLNQMVDNFIVKIPVNMQGIRAIKMLKNEGVTTLGTAIYTSQQAILAALAGASFVAPYFNRIDTLTGNAIETIESISHLLSYHGQTCRIIGASFKNTKQVIECLSVSQSSVTIPVELAYQMMENPCVNDAINKFHQDWVDCYGSLSH